MGKLIDETGNVYGKLVVIERAPSPPNNPKAHWLCHCACGNEIVVDGSKLRSGNTRSCRCIQAIDETGKVYGHLTVIERALSRNNSRAAYWRCHCACGKEAIIAGAALRGGVRSCCGRRVRPYDEVGKVYGKLTAIEQAEYHITSGGNRVVRWLCQCECGNQTIVRANMLRSGHTRSCGCLHKLPEGEAAFRKLYRAYKRGAKRRELKWDLTRKEFRFLTQQVCYYCGKEPSQVSDRGEGGNGIYIYNGVDRIDSDQGYFKGNVVPCCGECNKGKRDLPLDEFIDWIIRVYDHLIGDDR